MSEIPILRSGAQCKNFCGSDIICIAFLTATVDLCKYHREVADGHSHECGESAARILCIPHSLKPVPLICAGLTCDCNSQHVKEHLIHKAALRGCLLFGAMIYGMLISSCFCRALLLSRGARGLAILCLQRYQERTLE